jgi:hypothetical protein
VQQLTAKLIALLAVTAAVGFGAAFALARSGSGDDGAGTAPTAARTTLPTVATTGVDQTVRAVGAAAPLPDLRRRPRTNTQTTPRRTTTTTIPPRTITTQPPPRPPPTTTQSRPPPTTTQSPPTVTTG